MIAPGPEAKRPPHILLLMTRPPTMPDLPETTGSTKRRRSMLALGALVGVVAGLAAVYGIGAMQRNPADPACRASAELTRRLAPLARGEVAAVSIATSP